MHKLDLTRAFIQKTRPWNLKRGRLALASQNEQGERGMNRADSRSNRRQFFRGAVGVGTLAGLGLNLQPARAAAAKLKIAGAREVASVCPFCAVGCGQIVSVRDGQIINIEGNPDSPINRGTLCPKGAATYQLAVNPLRTSKVWHRAPGATEWDKTKTLDWAMDRIAQLVKT